MLALRLVAAMVNMASSQAYAETTTIITFLTTAYTGSSDLAVIIITAGTAVMVHTPLGVSNGGTVSGGYIGIFNYGAITRFHSYSRGALSVARQIRSIEGKR